MTKISLRLIRFSPPPLSRFSPASWSAQPSSSAFDLDHMPDHYHVMWNSLANSTKKYACDSCCHCCCCYCPCCVALLLLLVDVLQLLSKFLDSSTRDTANSRSEDHLQTENNHVLPATAFSILLWPFTIPWVIPRQWGPYAQCNYAPKKYIRLSSWLFVCWPIRHPTWGRRINIEDTYQS